MAVATAALVAAACGDGGETAAAGDGAGLDAVDDGSDVEGVDDGGGGGDADGGGDGSSGDGNGGSEGSASSGGDGAIDDPAGGSAGTSGDDGAGSDGTAGDGAAGSDGASGGASGGAASGDGASGDGNGSGGDATAALAARTDAELAADGINELGRIPVVEWHKIQDVDGRWENSLATFRAQLALLHERGYRPITNEQMATGRIDVPYGLSPVVLTFDDSYREHLYFVDNAPIADGREQDLVAAPDSVVGILQAMERDDPTWKARASFAFYWPYPFRETDPDVIAAKLRFLHANGFDLSNHSETHDDLRAIGDAAATASLANAEARLQEVAPDARMTTLTLPFGVWPNDRQVAVNGTHDGHTYRHDLVYLVGFQPTRSPHHADFDPTQVQRVQAWVEEFDKWMDWLDEQPGRRFVSDGDPDTVTHPVSWTDVAAPQPGTTARAYAEPVADDSAADG